MYIRQEADNNNMIFQADDGLGGNATYFFLDGSEADGTGNLYTNFPDKSRLTFGNNDPNGDLQIYHGSTNSHIDQNGSGDLYIKNSVVDGDIFFQGDDGTGTAVANYFTINGGLTITKFQKDTRHIGDVKAQFGNSDDLQIYHDSSDNNSYIKELGSGSLQIWAKDFEVYNADGTETLINADVNAGVQLYFDNSTKIATTSAGVTVTGSGIFTGNLNVNGNATLGDATTDDHVFNGQVTHVTADALGYKLLRSNGSTSMLISATGDSEIEFGTDNGSGTNTTQWTIGKDSTDNSFRISNSASLGTSDTLT